MFKKVRATDIWTWPSCIQVSSTAKFPMTSCTLLEVSSTKHRNWGGVTSSPCRASSQCYDAGCAEERWLILQAPSLGVGQMQRASLASFVVAVALITEQHKNVVLARTPHQTANRPVGEHACEDSLPIRPRALYFEVARRQCNCPVCSWPTPALATVRLTWNTVSAANRLSVAIRQCHRPRERDENTDRNLVETPSQWVDTQGDAARPAVRLCALWLPAVVPDRVLCVPGCSRGQYVAIVLTWYVTLGSSSSRCWLSLERAQSASDGESGLK